MLYGLILDAVVLGIIILAAFITAKHGFMRSLIEVAGFIISVIIIVQFSTPVSEGIYKSAVEPSIIKSAQQSVENTAESTSENLWKMFPTIVRDNAERMGINKDTLREKITAKNRDVKEDIKVACDYVAKPVFIRLISSLVAVIGFLLLVSLVKFLARIINKLFSFSLVGKLNRWLGFLLGVIKGLIFALLFCTAVGLLSTVYGGFYNFIHKAIVSSHIFKFIYGFVPFFN